MVNFTQITVKDIAKEVKDIMLTNIARSLPKTTVINDVKFIDYK